MSSRCCRRTWSGTCAWSSTDTGCTRRDPTSRPGPTAATCGCRTTRRSGTPRSPGSPPRTPTPIRGTKSTWPASGGCSARCCTRSRRGSGHGGRRTCCGRRGCSLHLRGVDERGAVDVTRLLTGSIADLLEGYFSSDALLGLLSVSGVIGTWAGPRSAGTAYVMLHHHIGETEGAAGAWGFPRGGMGGVSGALARAARMFGAQIRTDAEVAQIRTPAAGSPGSRWPAGSPSTRRWWSPPRTRRSRSCGCSTPRNCPPGSSPTSAAGAAAAAP